MAHLKVLKEEVNQLKYIIENMPDRSTDPRRVDPVNLPSNCQCLCNSPTTNSTVYANTGVPYFIPLFPNFPIWPWFPSEPWSPYYVR